MQGSQAVVSFGHMRDDARRRIETGIVRRSDGAKNKRTEENESAKNESAKNERPHKVAFRFIGVVDRGGCWNPTETKSTAKICSTRVQAKSNAMSILKQRHVAGAVRALSRARLSSYRSFFTAFADREAFGLYCWNESVSQCVSRALAVAEVVMRNQFHVALSRRYGVDGSADSRNWYLYLMLTKASEEAVKKLTHERRRVSGRWQLVARKPMPRPDDIVSKLTFGFWSHLLDAGDDITGVPIDWPSVLVEVLPGHRYKSTTYWSSRKNRDRLFARIDYCNSLRNRIAHLEPIWKAGPLLEEDRARQKLSPSIIEPPPSNPLEAITRLQLSYNRILEMMRWFSPEMYSTYVVSESHHRFMALNTPAGLDAYRMHGGHRRERPVEIGAFPRFRELKRELRRIGKRHGAAEVVHGERRLAVWTPLS